MALAAGTRIGGYEVVSLIGAGGMGEVYRARDTRLKRDVALKILPESFASDPDRLARFQREAELLAALSHPHIAGIYGFEEAGETRALVLEFVDGETLADRIARGPIPVEEALPIARQIADALEAAHEQGIIHRDLKPANIKLRPDGTVKVLDFGLAKLVEVQGAASAAALSMSPTLSVQATYAGVILGTASYMSPEQARGKTIDRRADIWAFGCVLFEMLTGQRAFPGEDLTETLATVVKSEPEWDALPSTLSPVIRAYLKRCLHKDPKQRVGDIRDVRLAVEGAFDTADPAAATSARARPSNRRHAIAALAVAAAFAIGLVADALVRWRAQTAAPPAEMRFDVPAPSSSGQGSSFAVSPDGRQVVYVGSGGARAQLWLRSLASTTPVALAGTEGARSPFWSPDSTSIAFFAEGSLKRLDLNGGQPRTITAPAAPQGGTWNRDGVILFQRIVVSSALFRVNAEGGVASPVTSLASGQTSHHQPAFLPDGTRFVFHVAGQDGGIFIGSLASAEIVRLARGNDSNPFYLESGWLVWIRDARLVAQRLDVEGRRLVGQPVTIADSAAVASASADDVIAFRALGSDTTQLRWFNRSGEDLGPLANVYPDMSNPRLSPDGRRAVVRRIVQSNRDLWLVDSSRTSRFTFDPASDDSPTWSPDGNRVAFRSQRSGTSDLYVKVVNSGAAETLLYADPAYKTPTDWSSDGELLVFNRTDPQTDMDIWVLPLSGARKPWLFLRTPSNERHGNVSPDRRWIAYMSNQSGQSEIYVRPFITPAQKEYDGGSGTASAQWQVSTAGGIFPRWAKDGHELYYIAPDARMMAVPIGGGTALDPGEPVALFQTQIALGGDDVGQGPMYDVSRDGRFLINSDAGDTSAPITVLLNWRPPSEK